MTYCDKCTYGNRNNIKNIYFHNKDAGEFMEQMKAQKQQVDVVFMDPPRSGSTEQFLNSLCSLNPEKVIYISCNPKTMADNLKYMKYYGYECVYLKPFDNFPLTKHIESIALLRKKQRM